MKIFVTNEDVCVQYFSTRRAGLKFQR